MIGRKSGAIHRLDFIVAGAQKSGTTAFHHFLSKNSDVCLPAQQELHFFDDEEIFSKRPVDYEKLHKHFNPRRSAKICGESTPNYLYWPTAMERIWEYNPQIKLIILLRNPIDRAFAHWNMQRFKKREPYDFLDALREEAGRTAKPLSIEARRFAYVGRGFYAQQLDRVFKFFPKTQVKITKFENFRDEKEKALNSIFEFLDVRPLAAVQDKDRNVVPYEREMTRDERKYLFRIFESEIGKLERMLGWDCSDWRL